MTFAQRRNRLTTHFSGSIPVVKRRISVLCTGSMKGTVTHFLCALIYTRNYATFQHWWHNSLVTHFSTGDTIHLRHSRSQNQGCVPYGYSVSWRNVISCTKVSRSPSTQFPPFSINLPADKYFTTLIRQFVYSLRQEEVSFPWIQQPTPMFLEHSTSTAEIKRYRYVTLSGYRSQHDSKCTYHVPLRRVRALLQWKSGNITYCVCVRAQP
jgi:hypothetical protein